MKFQLERILLFSDAVFAIAITLMIIEIKPPHLGHHVSFKVALEAFSTIIPTFIGTILSFFLIGHFWTRHHTTMKYMVSYDSKFIWLNFGLLLSIAFIPFSTAFIFENLSAQIPLPLIIYNINYIIATILCYRLFSYALDPKNNLCENTSDIDVKQIKKEILFPILVYVLVIILAMLNASFAAIGYSAFAFEKLFVRSKKQKSNN